MAKLSLQRLIKKFGFGKGDVSGANYQDLMTDVLAHNTKQIANATAKLSRNHWDRSLKKLSRTVREKRQFIIPDVSDVIPKDAVFFKKSAEQGQIITDTLRDRLTGDLRATLESFKTKTGEPSFIRRRGVTAGTMNPKLTVELEKSILATFTDYTKIDPKYGVPSNINTIAVTEARSTVNAIKESYNQKLMEDNPDIDMMKEWIQNKGLSKDPRLGHAAVNHKKIKFHDKFQVPLYKKIRGKLVRIGTTLMSRPHDPDAPLEQIIGCHCELRYFAQVT